MSGLRIALSTTMNNMGGTAMMLRKLIREHTARYFESTDWESALDVMARGRDEVIHAHVYTDSILHPHSIRDVTEAYFKAKNIAMERKIRFLSHGRGYGNVYYIQPAGMCHFEIFPRFTTETVLEPMAAQAARGGRSFEFWDRSFMATYYENFRFAEMGSAEAQQVAAYFQSPAWKEIYGVMYGDNERAVHSHAIVETSLHPEDILPIGQAAIEARGWRVDRGISVVFNVNGYDQGKITYLVAKPEIVLELEWVHNRDKVIEPATKPVARITTTDMVERDLAGLAYVHLEPDDIAWLTQRFVGGSYRPKPAAA